MVSRGYSRTWFVGALLLFVTAFPLPAEAEVPESPPELKQLLTDFRERRDQSLRNPIEARLARLHGQYAAALERGIGRATEQGNLDAVLELRNELQRLEDGEPCNLDRTFETASGRKLGKTYHAEIEEILVTDAKRRERFAARLDQALENLQADFTRREQVEQALEVKNYREGGAVTDFVTAYQEHFPSLPFDALAAAQEVESESVPNDSTPLGGGEEPDFEFEAIASIPPQERPSCRLVFLPIERPQGSPVPSTFRAIAAADRTDLVGVGHAPFPHVGVIRKDGAMMLWEDGPGEGPPETAPGSHVWCEQHSRTPLIGLNVDGTLSALGGEADPGLRAKLHVQRDVSAFALTHQSIGVIHRDGAVTVLGQNNHRTVDVIHSLEDVKDMQFAGIQYAGILLEDGTAFKISNGQRKKSQSPRGMERLHNGGLREDRSGTVITTAGNSSRWAPQWVIDKVGRDPRQVYSTSDFFGAIEEDGRFHLWEHLDNGEWEQREACEEALRGAFQFAWLNRVGDEWIAALLPADSVPRSGVWDAEELVKAREENEEF